MISELLHQDNIVCDVEANTWREVIQICGDLLMKEGSIEHSFIDSMVQVVETYGPYMILVPNVAFFHGSPDAGVNKVCMSLVTLRNEVVFDDFENQSIRCAFAFGAVDKESHLNILMNLTKLLQDEEFLVMLRTNGDKQAILKKLENY